ncbi:helix-turn-helix domain-containing protein [Streptomyces sp. NPDC002205]|uniref:helix-turn-helix domain-containing protein n=1 Tax=Streptomyces sp. NPDC002205 TaxID=3154411 RepID=UPI00331C4668
MGYEIRTGRWVDRRQESRAGTAPAAGRETLRGREKNREIVDALRVSERSVERWLRQWRERGEGPLEGLAEAHNSGPIPARCPGLRRSTTTFSTA